MLSQSNNISEVYLVININIFCHLKLDIACWAILHHLTTGCTRLIQVPALHDEDDNIFSFRADAKSSTTLAQQSSDDVPIWSACLDIHFCVNQYIIMGGVIVCFVGPTSLAISGRV